MDKLIAKLTEIFGPSGMESHVRKAIVEEIKDLPVEIAVDPLGNLVVTRKGRGSRLMMAAHMDEIGIIVTHIDAKGFLRIAGVGGIKPTQLVGQRFMFEKGIRGTVHHEKIKKLNELDWPKLYLDIGAANDEEARSRVSVGDMAVFDHRFVDLGERYMAKAMDDRVGCAIMIEVLRRLPTKVPRELVFVFTTQEEVGLRGARSSSFSVEPSYGIAVDVTMVGDTPEAPLMDVALGKGPAVKVKDSSLISHPLVRRLMVETAEKNGIPHQLEVLERGGTDAGAIHLSREGVPAGVVSIPCRYVHTASEMVDRHDVENAVILLEKLCLSPDWPG
ncbi:MAG: M42 family metallopeptidase [Firmicutes bacterium]|nr:M42 family metallopeptidase [Bacillota bacterium]